MFFFGPLGRMGGRRGNFQASSADNKNYIEKKFLISMIFLLNGKNKINKKLNFPNVSEISETLKGPSTNF